MSPFRILVVEDHIADIFLIREAIHSTGLNHNLDLVKDGEQATDYFDEADRDAAAPCPALVILDINLPKKDGGAVLRHMRNSVRSRDALVIAVSTSDSVQDREEMLRLGANHYFRKPSTYDDFLKLGDLIKKLLTSVPT